MQTQEQISTTKSCGGCTACCTVMGVDFPNYYKPPCQPCKHLAEAGGCSIYQTGRPKGCVDFSCLWLELDTMPSWARPDLLGVMFIGANEDKHWSPFHRRGVIARPVDQVERMWEEAATTCYHLFWHGGAAVWLDLPGRKKYLADEKGREIPPQEMFRFEAMLKQG